MSVEIVRTTCGYCSTGCNLSVHLEDGRPVKVEATADYPVNRGKACPKGFQSFAHLGAPDRALTPYLRDAAGQLRPIGWDRALSVFVERFKDLQTRYGPESVAFLSTGQITTEEFAYLGALAKFGMGVVHGDGNTRQCMATAAVAYKQAFGFDSPPFTYADFEGSDLLVFVGANPAIAHPIMWRRARESPRHPRMVVIDPRATETATETATGATIDHYPISPKSDLVLLYGLARILISRGWIDRDFIERHTVGFEAFAARVEGYGLERVTAVTGLSVPQVMGLAEMIREADRVSFWWTMGVNQGHQAVRTAQAIIDLALLTGNIGRSGTGPNSITGQCNAMGSRLFSNTASLFCGRDFGDPAHRAEVASILGIREALIPRSSSLAYDQILEAVDEGRIKGLWIVCTNPVHSWPDRRDLERVLAKAEFLVVQDMFADTETARMAHLVLPAAGCGEKDGTFINSERRIGVVRKVVDPPGEALPDLEIFRRVAEAWSCADLLKEWTSPEAVFQIMKRLSQGRPCDITGVADHAALEAAGGIQWPCPEQSLAGPAPVAPLVGERRLFADGRFFHADGRARFIFEEAVDPPEQTDAEHPFILLTGRGSVAQWHTLTRTDRAPLLKRMSPDPAYVEVSAADAARLGVTDGEQVEVRSRRGAVTVKTVVSEAVRPGQVFMPMHHPETNVLTIAAFDPYSRQPGFKYAAVSVGPTGVASADVRSASSQPPPTA